MALLLILLAGSVAGFINSLAGGGPIITLFALTLAGVDARVANLTSTVALLPGQIWTGWSGLAAASRHVVVSRLTLIAAGLGGMVGAALLIAIPSRAFALVVPWLVSAATAAYLATQKAATAAIEGEPPASLPHYALWLLPLLGIYGGFYGGGNSFLLLALFGWAGLTSGPANSAKNLLVAVINGAAAVVFVASGEVAWLHAGVLAIGNLCGSWAGLRALDRIGSGVLRTIVVAAGVVLAAVLFWQAYGR